MGKKELKKQYKNLEINLIDYLTRIDETPTKKITPFITKQFNEWIKFKENELRKSSTEDVRMRTIFGDPENEFEETLLLLITRWIYPKLDMINDFVDHLEANRLEDNDISNYQTWDDINRAVNEAELKHNIKSKRNRVEVLHKDENWLVLKPFSMEASINYGYGTTWCTAMKENSEYFHKYTSNGSLIYVINRKVSDLKYAFYSSPKEFSVWTVKDRRIDSLEAKIPVDLLLKIRDWSDYKKYGVNYDHFLEEDKYKPQNNKARALIREEPVERPDNYDEQVDQIREADREYEEAFETELPTIVVEMREIELPITARVQEETLGEVLGIEDESLREDVNDYIATLDFEDEDVEIMEAEDIPEDAIPADEETAQVWAEVRLDDPVMENAPVGGIEIGRHHGSIDTLGERTWSDPYPEGIPQMAVQTEESCEGHSQLAGLTGGGGGYNHTEGHSVTGRMGYGAGTTEDCQGGPA